MGNSRKPSAPIKGQVREMKPLTAEERQEQAARLYMHVINGDSEGLASFALEVADKFIEKLYFTQKEEE